MCTDTAQRYLRRILVSDFKQTKCWPIISSLRRCQCSPPPAYLSMCTDTPQRYLRRILILDFKQKNAGRPFSFQNRFSLLWQPCYHLDLPQPRRSILLFSRQATPPSLFSTSSSSSSSSDMVCASYFGVFAPTKWYILKVPSTPSRIESGR